MQTETKYFITNSNGFFVSWHSDIAGLETRGQKLSITTGSIGDDSVYVGRGTQVNATGLTSSRGNDSIYLTGTFDSYTQHSPEANSTEYKLSRIINIDNQVYNEIISFVASNGDKVYFSDGYINLDIGALQNTDRTLKPLSSLTLITTEKTPDFPLDSVQAVTKGNNTHVGETKIFISDPNGENISPGIKGSVLSILTSSIKSDTVYVAKGTQINAIGLTKSRGEDSIYLTGNFAEYTQAPINTSQEYKLSRMVDIQGVQYNESVIFVASNKDRIYFADGYIKIDKDILINTDYSYKALTAGMLDTSEITPGLNTVGSITNINGITEKNQTLTAGTITDKDGFNLAEVTYQWQMSTTIDANYIDILNATNNSLSLTQAHLGKFIRVKVNYVDAKGTTEDLISIATTLVKDADIAGSIANITGEAIQGKTLTAATPIDLNGIVGTPTYQWQASTTGTYTNINNATNNTFVLTQEQTGKTIRVKVTYTDALSGEKILYCDSTAVVIDLDDLGNISDISGTPIQNSRLSAGTLTDLDGGITQITYQWQANGVDIFGATTDSIMLTQNEIGKIITVIINYSDNHGSNKSVRSNPTIKILSQQNNKQINEIGETSTSDTHGVSAINSKSHWNPANKEITYSFNAIMPEDYRDFNEGHEDGWKELNNAQKLAVRLIFIEIEKLLGVTFVEVADTSSQSDGDIQFNMTNMQKNISGYAYLPGNQYYSGDVFLSNKFNTESERYSLDVAEWGWSVITHEIGHALGLKHPFEGDITLPTNEENINHTIMSYSRSNALILELSTLEESLSYVTHTIKPQLFSLYDVNALQAFYDVNLATNKEDTTYSYKYTDYERNTIWDAGGVDLIDLSMCIGNSTIDLNPGSLNSIDQYTIQEIISLHQNTATNLIGDSRYDDWLNNEINELTDLYTGKDNLGIAMGAIIENLNTGSGDDIITDNLVDNIINAGKGDDKIYVGNGGHDIIDGGDNQDTLYLDLLQTDITQKIENEYTFLYSSNFTVQFTGIEALSFSDGSTLMV